MSWRKNWEWSRTWYQSVLDKIKHMKKDQLVILLLAGVLLLVISIPTEKESGGAGREEAAQEREKNSAAAPDAEEDYAGRMEKRLAGVLASVDGVGRVEVMITLEGSRTSEVLKDVPTIRNTSSEADSAGGTRTSMELETTETTVYTTDEQGNQVPYVRCETEPVIRGILIVAEGGGNPVTAAAITDAAEALFQVEPHRIKVMKRKIQG